MSMMMPPMLTAFDQDWYSSLSEAEHDQVEVLSLSVAHSHHAFCRLCHSWRYDFGEQMQQWRKNIAEQESQR